MTAYDPVSGDVKPIALARQLMLTYLTRWARDFHIDGVRMDSVENVANWDFIGEFKEFGHRWFKDRWNEQKLDPAKADEHFLVIGEELSLPFGLSRAELAGNPAGAAVARSHAGALCPEGVRRTRADLPLGGESLHLGQRVLAGTEGATPPAFGQIHGAGFLTPGDYCFLAARPAPLQEREISR